MSTESLDLAESFVYMPEVVRVARETAQGTGNVVPTNGGSAALTFLARCIDAQTVVVVGLGPGVVGMSLFAGMPEAGVITGIDIDNDWLNEARLAFVTAGVASNRYRLIAGVALKVMSKLRDGAYDMVVIAGDILDYVEYIAQSVRLLRPGGMLVLTDILWHNLVANPRCEDDEALIIREAMQVIQQEDDFTPLIIPLGDGILAAIKN